MNVLETYIVTIHKVKPYAAEWTKEFKGKKFVNADITTNCYGREKRGEHIFEDKEWEEIKAKGYYMV